MTPCSRSPMGGNYKASHLRKTTGQGHGAVRLSLHYSWTFLR